MSGTSEYLNPPTEAEMSDKVSEDADFNEVTE